MDHILEVDEAGILQLPAKLLGDVKPHTRYVLMKLGTALLLQPVVTKPFWMQATPAERASAIRDWAARERPSAPVLSDEALQREQMYD